jgi:ribA/ribD-fused uncharacterized protein
MSSKQMTVGEYREMEGGYPVRDGRRHVATFYDLNEAHAYVGRPAIETGAEPTAEMIQQGIWAWQRNERNSTADDVRAIYMAMRRVESRSPAETSRELSPSEEASFDKAFARSPRRVDETSAEHHGLDNARQVFFYEQDYYVLSNFSAFRLNFGSIWHDTSEHAYHWMKFRGACAQTQMAIATAESAHDAFKIAERYRDRRRSDWDAVKVDVMRQILRAKANQHEYVRRKLLATGDRELIENSWRDDFWGWGPNRDGQNMLGQLWMEIRAELRSALKAPGDANG